MNTKNDIVISFLKGDENAFSKIYYTYKKVACFTILSYVNNPNDVEDIYHDVLIKVIENRSSISSPKSFESYLLTTAKHTAINYCEKNNRAIPSSEIESVKSTYDESTIDDLLPYNISTLEKQIISMRVVFDMPWKNICVLLEMPISTAKHKYRVALSKIREEIRDDKTKKTNKK